MLAQWVEQPQRAGSYKKMSLKIQQRAVLTAILEGNLTNVFDFLKMHEVVRSMHELLEKIKMRYNFDTDDIYTEFMGSINHAKI